jgi:hypothetical protein
MAGLQDVACARVTPRPFYSSLDQRENPAWAEVLVGTGDRGKGVRSRRLAKGRTVLAGLRDESSLSFRWGNRELGLGQSNEP